MIRHTLALLTLVAVTFAQEKASGKYENAELGVDFTGVYGWEAKFAQGSGAWNDLASYRNESWDATVVLQIRNNTYATMSQLRDALKKEFTIGGEPTPGNAVYKEIVFRDVEMKKGLGLKGIEAEGHTIRLTDEGKKREHFVVARTYFGKSRLFRVQCTAKRSRMSKVQDLFQMAMAGLTCSGEAEQVAEGTLVESARGSYSVLVPTGFSVYLAVKSTYDLHFVNKRDDVEASLYSYAFSGELIDHRDQITDYYRDAVTLEDDDVKLMGGLCFRGVVKKDGKITLMVGTVRNGRAYRIQVQADPDKKEAAQRALDAFVKNWNVGR